MSYLSPVDSSQVHFEPIDLEEDERLEDRREDDRCEDQRMPRPLPRL